MKETNKTLYRANCEHTVSDHLEVVSTHTDHRKTIDIIITEEIERHCSSVFLSYEEARRLVARLNAELNNDYNI